MLNEGGPGRHWGNMYRGRHLTVEGDGLRSPLLTGEVRVSAQDSVEPQCVLSTQSKMTQAFPVLKS